MPVLSDGKGGLLLGDPADKGKKMVCDTCGGPICTGQTVGYEPRGNRWTHVEPKCKDIT